METRTIHLYSINELSEEAREHALTEYRNNNHEIFWSDELLDSFKTLFKKCDNISLNNYSLGLERSYIKVSFTHDEIEDFTGKRALAWLENNLIKNLRITRAEYLKNRKNYIQYKYKIGYLKDCPLTGVCYDIDFIDSLYTDIKKGYSLKEAFKNLADTYERILYDEYTYQNSNEYIIEHLEVNEYRFFANGEQFN